jgi:hypothetical protein
MVFVAAIHVQGFNAADVAVAAAERVRFVEYSHWVIEEVAGLARSLGATLVDLHGDQFLMCLQVRNVKKTRAPTKFVLGVVALSNAAKARFGAVRGGTPPVRGSSRPAAAAAMSSDDPRRGPSALATSARARQLGPSNRHVVVSCGVAFGRARVVRGSGESLARPVTFVGRCVQEACAIERHMRCGAAWRSAPRAVAKLPHAIGVYVGRIDMFESAKAHPFGRLGRAIWEDDDVLVRAPKISRVVDARRVRRTTLRAADEDAFLPTSASAAHRHADADGE